MAESSTRFRSTAHDSLGESLEMKGAFKVSDTSEDVSQESPTYHGNVEQWGDTSNDLRDMQRLGKTQEFT